MIAACAVVLTAVVGIVFFVLFIGGWRSVPVDRLGLHYTGGPIQGQEFVAVIDCDDESGWDEMLRVNFRGPIEQAIQQSIRGFTVDELYAGVGSVDEEGDDEEATAILEQVQNTIAADLKENINNVLGGAYFCGPTFERSQPDVCPDFQFQITSAVPTSEEVRAAFAENAASQRQVVTAQNRADAAAAEAEGQRRAQEALAGSSGSPATSPTSRRWRCRRAPTTRAAPS